MTTTMNYHNILIAIFIIYTAIQLFYYWYFFSRLAFYRKKPAVRCTHEPVSVVICAHNESDNLQKNLPEILSQNYPDFEVVVVNDGSNDDTEAVLLELSNHYKHLKLINIKSSVTFYRSKKLPLSVGIRSAAFDLILLTDADCRPTSNQWISTIQQNFNEKTEIVLGYGPYEKKKGFLNLLIRYDTFHTALQYMGYALAGQPFMGVGRNLAYRRSLFFQNKGFINHYKVTSGDDDLFVNYAATGTNTAIETDLRSHMTSRPKESWASWIYQKNRHYGAGKYYRSKFRLMLGTYHFSAISYYILLAVIVGLWVHPIVAVSAHLVRMLSRLALMKLCSSKLNEGKLYLFSPLLDPFFTFFSPLVALRSIVFPATKWR